MLTDNHGRKIDYLRLAVTDRCNLRCLYCMPESGLNWVPKNDLLSFEEIEKLLIIFSKIGIRKLRFTGGEPFLRKDFPLLLESISKMNLFESISITTNGTLTLPYISKIKELGIHSINLSLDTIDEKRFFAMTRRDDFSKVMDTFHALLEYGIKTKINAVILEGKNEEDILALTSLSKTHPVDVRFIEEMPFNGAGDRHAIKWNYKNILAEIKNQYPNLYKIEDEISSTSLNYHIPGHLGNIGVIAAWSRNFCGTCNRIRVTPKGMMKTCLYDEGKVNLLELIRNNSDDKTIVQRIYAAIGNRALDGNEAEKQRGLHPVNESMATIGG